MKQLYVILFFLTSFVSTAQKLLKDIVTSNASSHPRGMVEANGKQFFVAKGLNSVQELWMSDGTFSGTRSVLNPEVNNKPYIDGLNLLAINNKVFFRAYSYSPDYTGTELWVSDGTPGGTRMVKDINPGQVSSYPSSFFKLGDKMIFIASNGVHGSEPWVTDGTSEGTFMLRDLSPGSTSSYLNSAVVANNKLFFSIYSQNEGTELWVTDGSQGGTYMVKDIFPGSSSANPSSITAVGNKVYFSANDGTYGSELWVSDGTYYGTQLVKDIHPGSYSSSPSNIFEYNGKLVFSAQDSNYDIELWISDGTEAGTYQLKNIAANYSSNPRDFIKVGNNLFFTATDGVTGRELWKTNGTTAGTQLVKDINLTSTETDDYTFPLNSTRRKFIAAGGKLFFVANSGAEGFELWKSDGTSAGTTLVKDFSPGTVSSTYSTFMALGSNLVVTVTTNTGESTFIKTDGTQAGTIRMSDINPSITFRNEYPLMVNSANQLYFVAYDDQIGYELFKTDGNTVNLVRDIDTNLHYGSSNFSLKGGVNNKLFFNYDDNEHGMELWRTDGFNTNLFMDFVKYPSGGPNSTGYYSASSTFNEDFISLNGYVYIPRGNVLWRSNGENLESWQVFSSIITSIGVSGNKIRLISFNNLYELEGNNVTLVKTFDDWNYYGYTVPMYDVNGTSYFMFPTYQYGFELWKTDGTAQGTTLVKDMTPGPGSSGFGYNFCKVGNKVFFSNNSGNGYELWVTDGTEWGTYQVKDIFPGSSSSYPENLTSYNNLLLFSANNGTHGTELWKSDGTYDGTVMVSDINYGSNSSNPSNYGQKGFAIYNNKAYFTARGSYYYPDLYATDGNSTTLVKSYINAQSITAFNNELFFNGYSYSHYLGDELWKTNGTMDGTTLVKDINPGEYNSNPTNFFVHNNALYFTANDGIHGQELWVLTPCADSLNLNSGLSGTNTYQASKVIVGETANNISSTANITYDAGKYVLLKPGFNTSAGAVFQTNLVGCGNSNQALSNTPQEPQPINEKTAMYIQDMQEAPSIEDFIEKGDNQDLALIWAKYLEESRIVADKEYQLQHEVNKLNEQQKDVKASNNQETLNNYYTSKAQKQQAYQEAKQEAGLYNYIIVPVRDKDNKKLGYDLTIYAAGKMHQLAIRY